MTAFNVVRTRVKPGRNKDYLASDGDGRQRVSAEQHPGRSAAEHEVRALGRDRQRRVDRRGMRMAEFRPFRIPSP